MKGWKVSDQGTCEVESVVSLVGMRLYQMTFISNRPQWKHNARTSRCFWLRFFSACPPNKHFSDPVQIVPLSVSIPIPYLLIISDSIDVSLFHSSILGITFLFVCISSHSNCSVGRVFLKTI